MVTDGVSLRRIKSYLRRWCAWWVRSSQRSSQNWQYEELLMWFLQACRDAAVARVAAEILQEATPIDQDHLPVGLNARAIA